MDHLRNGGHWRKVELPRDDNNNAEVFISFKKSRERIFLETAGRKLKQVLNPLYPEKSRFLNRTEAKITADWVPIVKVEVLAPPKGLPTMEHRSPR